MEPIYVRILSGSDTGWNSLTGQLEVTTTQNVRSSTLNHTSTPLAGLASYTGTKESTLGVAGIQVMMKADTNCTVHVDQTGDGTNWDVVDSFTYLYSKGGYSWTIQAVGTDYRVRVENLSSSAQTYLRLDVALCPIVEAVPRSLSESGNFKVSVEEMLGTFGTKAKTSPQGKLITTETVRLAGATFNGTTVDTNYWSKGTPSGSADWSQTGGQITLATGATANSSITVNSARVARYAAGNSNFCRIIARFPAVVVLSGSNTRRIGAFDADNGYFFETNGATLKLVCRKATFDTNSVSSGSFNGDYGATYSLDTFCHTYEIYWSNKSVWFLIDDVLIHKFTGSTAPLSDTNSLKLGFQNTNAGGNTGANTLEVRVATIYRIGKALTRPMWVNTTSGAAVVLKRGAGTLHSVTVNKKSGAPNTITVYDSLIASNPICSIDVNANYGTHSFGPEGIDFYTGLCYTISGGSPDVTIVWE